MIFGADVAHAVVVRDVVLAVRKLQAALKKVGGVMLGIVEARRDPQAKKIRGMKVGAI